MSAARLMRLFPAPAAEVELRASGDRYEGREDLGNNFNGPTGQGIEDAGYVKLREISATYVWENRRVRDLTGFTSIELRLAARNLKTWTDYSGVDPETNLEGSFGIGRGQDYFNNPQTRSFIFSINLSH